MNPMDMVQQLEANYFAHVRSMALEHNEEGGLEWAYTGVSMQNRVFNARLQPQTLDAQILSVLQRFARWDVPLSWDITPSNQPAKLARELERFGFSKRATLRAMTLELSRLQPQSIPPNLALQAVDQHNLSTWAKFVGLANDMPKTRIAMLQTIYGRTLGQPRWQHFLVYLEQEGVGTCSLFESEGVLGLYWLTVLPKFRKRGLATATLTQLLQSDLVKHQTAVLLAPQSCRGLCQKLGFEEVGGMETYQVKPV